MKTQINTRFVHHKGLVLHGHATMFHGAMTRPVKQGLLGKKRGLIILNTYQCSNANVTQATAAF